MVIALFVNTFLKTTKKIKGTAYAMPLIFLMIPPFY
jgi:hypothetical protein